MATNNFPNAASASIRLYKRIALTFIGLTLVLLGVVLAATLSRATVTVTAKDVPVSSHIKIAVASDNQTSETVRGKVVATTVSGEKTAQPAGEGQVVTGKAAGTVMLVNKRSVPQSLIATTRLLTKEGVLFRLVKGVTIPANGELKDVAVVADQPGAGSMIGASSFTVPGLSTELQKLVYAFSEKPMSGGSGTQRVVAQSDIDSAFAVLREELTRQANAVLAAQAGGANYGGSATFVQEEARSVAAKPGDAVDSFTVLLRITVTDVFYDKNKLDNLGLAALRANMPTDMELGSNDVATTQVTVQNADATTGTATLEASYSGKAIITPASSVLDRSRLAGLDAATIKAYLKSFDSVADASVKLSPFWVTRAPTDKKHIQIIVK
jgi:hypothetical protein